jgi:hypothetical protein
MPAEWAKGATLKRRWIQWGGLGALALVGGLFLVSPRFGGLGLIVIALLVVVGVAYELL